VKRGKRVPPTQILRPPLVVDNEEEVKTQQRALGRKLGAEKKHLDAQLPAEVSAAIDDGPDVNASALARWLQADPVMKKFVAHADGEAMQHRSLAKKIIRYRQQK
jgi:hypothetical protein